MLLLFLELAVHDRARLLSSNDDVSSAYDVVSEQHMHHALVLLACLSLLHDHELPNDGQHWQSVAFGDHLAAVRSLDGLHYLVLRRPHINL